MNTNGQPATPYQGFEQDYQLASDIFKSLHGFRPRHMYDYWRTLTQSEMYAEIARLDAQVARLGGNFPD